MDLPALPAEEDYLDYRENKLRSRGETWRLNILLTGGYLQAALVAAGVIVAWHYWGRH